MDRDTVGGVLCFIPGLIVAVLIAIVGCHGGNNAMGGDSRVVCFSGGQLIAEYYVEGIVWINSAGFTFDLPDGTAVMVTGDCIVEEIQD